MHTVYATFTNIKSFPWQTEIKKKKKEKKLLLACLSIQTMKSVFLLGQGGAGK